MIARWLRSKIVAVDCRVQKPDKKHDDTKGVHQEVDEYLEISLTGPDEFSFACGLSDQLLRTMLESMRIRTEQEGDIKEKQDIHHDHRVI